jgi:hydrogenase expression/formation protein HypE
MRDPTRGGVAATLNEIARAAGVGVEITERALPIPAQVRDACGLLGLDPLYVANEGKLLARAHEHGGAATVIGRCVEEHRGMVVARTGLGGTRVVDLPLGEQLPRIC